MDGDPLSVIKKADPELFGLIGDTRDKAFEEGKLTKKDKLLIALAIDCAKHSVNGIKALTLQALECGATKEEIAETLRVAYYICGVGSIYCAAEALKDIL
ncbi:MAG: carboxymuconolactone decarboxylase family protein [Syntrophorhabdaceae bacterium]|nr:carboxymuconolactone decarboxylase family protein [Syntrophorhabdaceae bacterium]